MHDPTTTPDALAAPHPALRAVRPPEAPYPGVLRRAGERTLLFVDAADFGDAAAWRCDPGGHVLAPLDLARRADGHDVVLEHCIETVEALLDRRASSTPLAEGETVTLAVSLGRGLAALVATGDDPDAEWWLTDAGRPVLACTAAGRPATISTADVLARLRAGAHARLAAALTDLEEAARHPRALLRDGDPLEDALFAAATPQPIDRDRKPAVSSLAALRPTRIVDEPAPADRWDDLLRAHLDAGLVELAGAAARSVGRRVRRSATRLESADAPPRRHRGRPWVLAACLAGAVVVAGLLWPTGEGSAEARTGDASPSATPQDAETPAAVPSAPSEQTAAPTTSTEDRAAARGGDDPLAAAAALLAEASMCAGDTACAGPLVEEVAGPTAQRLAAIAVDAATPELVDAFGGAAVVRVAHGGVTSLVVVVGTPEGWRVRDVYDVADPP